MRQKDFDAAMKEFRASCVDLAGREQRGLEARRPMRAEKRVRWVVPAFAALLLAAAGSGWAAWEHARAPQPRPQVAVMHAGDAVRPAPVSDDALLSEVQNDLSDNVPQALQPLAVSYTGNKQARNGQEEVQ